MFCTEWIGNINKSCEASMGGIKEVYVLPVGFIDQPYTPNTKDVKEGLLVKTIITHINTLGDFHTDTFSIRFRPQTGNAEASLVNTPTNKVAYYENTINLVLNALDSDKFSALNRLSDVDVAAIVVDNNDRVWYYGYDRPLRLTELVAQTGTAFNELNGYEITISGVTKYRPLEIDKEWFDSHINELPTKTKKVVNKPTKEEDK